jgi:hypothetical protein
MSTPEERQLVRAENRDAINRAYSNLRANLWSNIHLTMSVIDHARHFEHPTDETITDRERKELRKMRRAIRSMMKTAERLR